MSESAAADPTWTLRVASEPPDAEAGSFDVEQLGRYEVGGAELRLSRTSAGLWLAYPPFGRCLINPGGAELTWYPGEDSAVEFLRAVVLGPVLALALHVAGTLSLHGSAVGIDGRAIAVLAPKYHGKSTLALALVGAGAQLVTDDAIAVDVAPTPTVRPGVHSVRLWRDSAGALATEAASGRVVPGVKHTVVGLPRHMLAADRLPLAAVYVLDPVPAEEGVPAAERTRMSPLHAAMALALHTKLADPLIGVAMAAEQLRWAAALARAVPVYSLAVARDFARLPAAVAQLQAWTRADAGGTTA